MSLARSRLVAALAVVAVGTVGDVGVGGLGLLGGLARASERRAAPRDGDRPDPSLAAQAEELLRQAYGERTTAARFALADRAAALARRAIEAEPKRVEPYLTLAAALSVSDPEHPERCRPTCDAALDALAAARAVDIHGVDARRIPFEEGIILSRLGRWEEALAAYDRALARTLVDAPALFPLSVVDEIQRESDGRLHTNAAETLMAVGHLSEAIARYRLADELLPRSAPLERKLALVGLAVALDRDGQGGAAEEAMGRVLDLDPLAAALHDDAVFFEPVGDLHYYVALAHETAYRRWSAPLDRDRALAAWRRYLAAQPTSRYAARARARLERLTAETPRASVPVARARAVVPDVGSGLDQLHRRRPSEIRELVRKNEDTFEVCYARVLAHAPTYRADFPIALLVGENGYVKPQLFDGAFDSPQLADCLTRAISLWTLRPLHSTAPSPQVETVMVRVELWPEPRPRRAP
jgi:tetratricopeptide (TPR) repeat protein